MAALEEIERGVQKAHLGGARPDPVPCPGPLLLQMPPWSHGSPAMESRAKALGRA